MLDIALPKISTRDLALDDIGLLDKELEQHFKDKFSVELSLTRLLVSFQANKTRPVYRWYKYKEAFSATLVEYLFERNRITKGRILDPFAGIGTALFAASKMGIDSDGIELLPIGQQIIDTKKLLETEITVDDFEAVKCWIELRIWERPEERTPLPELRITKGAYPTQTRESIEKYLGACQLESGKLQVLLNFYYE